MKPISFLGNGCKISLVSTEPQLFPPEPPKERNWILIGLVAAVVIVALALFLMPRSTGIKTPVTPVSAPLDPYAANLVISRLQLSTAENPLGAQQLYIDGRITNTGALTVTAATVQILFRDFNREVAQNETQPLRLIRTRDPYIDVQPISAAPIKPGASADFHLIFDSVVQEWDGAYPDIRLIHVEAK